MSEATREVTDDQGRTVEQVWTDVEAGSGDGAELPPSKRDNPLVDGAKKRRTPKTRRTVRSGSGAGPNPPSPTARAPRAKAKPTDLTEPIAGIFQLVAGLGYSIGKKINNVVIQADAVSLAIHARPMAAGLNTVAQQHPGVMSAIEKITAAGPYAAAIQPVLEFALQVAVNHKPELHEATKAFGTKTIPELLGAEVSSGNGRVSDSERLVSA